MRPLILLLPLSIACGVSEEKFAAQAAELNCERYQNCDLLESYGDDVQACMEAVEIIVLQQVEGSECSYDPGAARDCLGELKDSVEQCDADPTLDDASACTQYCEGEGA